MDDVFLTESTVVVDHLDDLFLWLSVELRVARHGEVLVMPGQVLPQDGQLHLPVALAAEGLDAVGEGVAVHPGGGLFGSWRGGGLGLLEDRGV